MYYCVCGGVSGWQIDLGAKYIPLLPAPRQCHDAHSFQQPWSHSWDIHQHQEVPELELEQLQRPDGIVVSFLRPLARAASLIHSSSETWSCHCQRRQQDHHPLQVAWSQPAVFSATRTSKPPPSRATTTHPESTGYALLSHHHQQITAASPSNAFNSSECRPHF